MGSEKPTKKKRVIYLSEPTINSELILKNNRDKLKKDPSLLNEEHIEEIEALRAEYEELDNDDSPGLQKTKRDIRNRIRDLSSATFTDRDPSIFGGMALKIIDNMATRPNFSRYSYLDEMKSLASTHIVKYTWRFDSYRQSKITGQYVSAFTYISTIVFRAFLAVINKQKEEYEKAKEDFLETQKLFHRDPNCSTYIPDHSEIGKTVTFVNIEETLLDEIHKIILDVDDIMVRYPEEYKINMDEYIQITQFSKKENINLSLVRILKDEEKVKSKKTSEYDIEDIDNLTIDDEDPEWADWGLTSFEDDADVDDMDCLEDMEG